MAWCQAAEVACCRGMGVLFWGVWQFWTGRGPAVLCSYRAIAIHDQGAGAGWHTVSSCLWCASMEVGNLSIHRLP
jgi:hypothetical protein